MKADIGFAELSPLAATGHFEVTAIRPADDPPNGLQDAAPLLEEYRRVVKPIEHLHPLSTVQWADVFATFCNTTIIPARNQDGELSTVAVVTDAFLEPWLPAPPVHPRSLESRNADPSDPGTGDTL